MEIKKERVIKILRLMAKEIKKYEKPTVRRTSEKEDPFKTLITCLLSLRTQDKNTAKTSQALFKVADTPRKILKLPRKKLEKLIFSSGYYKNKAKTIKHVSKILLEKYKGKVPSTREKLLEIKGIGPKTANIVLCFAYKQNFIPVDTHVHVISNRLGWVRTKSAEKTEPELEKIVPKKYWQELNTIFVLFGQKVCQTQSPLCSKCPVKKLCLRIGVEKSR
jgi:endonuclease-3